MLKSDGPTRITSAKLAPAVASTKQTPAMLPDVIG
jgi:hypothetical protein